MEKVIKIGDKDVKLSNNIVWAMEYRDQFNKDPLETFMPIFTTLIEAFSSVVSETGENITLRGAAEAIQGRAFDITLPLTQLGFVDSVLNITWALAKAADEGIAPPKQWARQFDSFHVDEVLPEVYGLIMKQMVSSKNRERLTGALKSLNLSASTLSFLQEQSED